MATDTEAVSTAIKFPKGGRIGGGGGHRAGYGRPR